MTQQHWADQLTPSLYPSPLWGSISGLIPRFTHASSFFHQQCLVAQKADLLTFGNPLPVIYWGLRLAPTGQDISTAALGLGSRGLAGRVARVGR
jgi:hypothetical protein